MLRGGEHPPGALQLMDASQALQPGAVDEILLRDLACDSVRPASRDAKVSVDGIAGQIDARVLGTRTVHRSIIGVTALLAEGVELFNKGHYWEAHEVWEREWTADRRGRDAGIYQ